MNLRPPKILETLDARGRGFRVAFTWRDDRFTHELFWLDAGVATSLLSSLDGAAADAHDWPRSPAFQQLHLESRGEDHVALLVGMAGKSHYSAAIETRGADGAIEFDIAARIHRAPDFLGSSYRVTADRKLCEYSDSGLRISIATGISLFAAVDCLWRPTADGVEIGPPLRHDLTLPTTVRWRYRVAVRPRGDSVPN